MVASAAAQASGWLLYVRPPANTLSRKWSATLRRRPTAPSGTYALVRPLAIVRMSGTTPQWFTANHSPVRPNPDITSSAMSRMPYLSHSARTPWRYPSGGTRMPLVPVTGSTMKPAIVLGPSSWMTSSSLAKRVVDRVPPALNAVVRIGHVHDAGDAGLGRPSPRIAGERDRAGGRAVIRAVARQDLVAAGVPARRLDRVLVGLGAAVGEEEAVDVAGRDGGELRAQARANLGGHERVGVRQLRRLLLDGLRRRAGRRGRC